MEEESKGSHLFDFWRLITQSRTHIHTNRSKLPEECCSDHVVGSVLPKAHGQEEVFMISGWSTLPPKQPMFHLFYSLTQTQHTSDLTHYITF